MIVVLIACDRDWLHYFIVYAENIDVFAAHVSQSVYLISQKTYSREFAEKTVPEKGARAERADGEQITVTTYIVHCVDY